jgi:hypothetical protein
MSYQDILNSAKTFQAIALLGENVHFARKKKKKTKDFIRMGTVNIVGTELLKE